MTLLSLIVYRDRFQSPDVPLGLVLFAPPDPPIVRLIEHWDTHLEMACRAVCNRILRANPQTLPEIERFVGQEANEVRLALPVPVLDEEGSF